MKRSSPIPLALASILVLSLLLGTAGTADGAKLLWKHEAGGDVKEVDMSADGQWLVAATLAKDVLFFERTSSTPSWTHRFITEIGDVTITPSGDHAAVAHWGNPASSQIQQSLFDRDTGGPFWNFTSHGADPGELGCYVAISNGAGVIASSGATGVLFVSPGVNASQSDRYSFSPGDEHVLHLSITADGTHLVMSTGVPENETGAVYVLDGPDGWKLYEKHRKKMITKALMSGDKKSLVYLGETAQGNDHLYFVALNDESHNWSRNSSSNILLFGISADGGHIVTGEEGYLRLSASKDGKARWTAAAQNGTFTAGDISSDGKYIVAGTSAGELLLFTKGSSKPIWKTTLDGPVRSVRISATGEYIFVGTGTGDNQVHLFYNELPEDDDGGFISAPPLLAINLTVCLAAVILRRRKTA